MMRRTISVAFSILFSAHSLLTAGLAQEKQPIIYVRHLEPPRGYPPLARQTWNDHD